jgi:hypothetical protein
VRTWQVYHNGKVGLENVWKSVFQWNRRDYITAYFTQSELEASIIECYMMWSRMKSLAGSERKDGRHETAFYCRYCDLTMRNKNKFGEYLDSEECTEMD